MAAHSVDAPNLLNLPVELLESLVLSPNLAVPDICALSRVCWMLNHVVSRVWAKIVKSRWKYWGRVSLSDVRESKDWYQLCRHRYLCEVHTLKILGELMKKGYHVIHLSGDELDCFADFLKEKECPKDVLLCVLDDVLYRNQRQANLTYQYYALFSKEYITWMGLAEKWQELLTQQSDPQVLEKGAILLSQWMNPCKQISPSTIHEELDSIAQQVAVELLQTSGGQTAASQRLRDNDTSSQSYKSEEEEEEGDRESSESKLRRLCLPTEVVLDAVNTVLYNRLCFSPPSMDQYYNLENSFIDQVLAQKKGLPITMCIVYQAVARRLGVTLSPVNFPAHFMLQIPHNSDSDLEGTKAVFVDAFARGVRRSYTECCAMINRVPKIEVADPLEVFMRMTANIYTQSHNMFAIQNLDREYDREIKQWGPLVITSALSLQLVLCSLAEVKPWGTVIHRALHLTHMCLELNYAMKKVTEVATKLKDTHEGQRFHPLLSSASKFYDEKQKKFQDPPKPKQRSEELTYRIGMIMKHRRYDYRCVIYGWDLTCKMSDLWIAQMGVDRLPNGRNQPFYNVLVEDGTNRYASQENLFPCPQEELVAIEHWEVGRFFVSYEGDHYDPNDVLKENYPYD